MFIPFIKNDQDLTIEKKSIPDKLVAFLDKKNLSEEITPLNLKFNETLNHVFAFEFSDIEGYKKVLGVQSLIESLYFLVDNSGCFYYFSSKRRISCSFSDTETTKFIQNAYIKNFLKEIIKGSKRISLSPYHMNEVVERHLKKIFLHADDSFVDYALRVDTHLYFKYKGMFKKEAKYFSSYFKNKLFGEVDKDLFKNLYSYFLHQKDTQIYNNYLKSSEKIQKNFNLFKKEHNFLSMILADQKRAMFTVLLNNYNMVLSNVAIELGVTLEEIKPLENKSYNDFLYIKTPKKYFNILKKYNLKITKRLSLKQVKFLNDLVYKNKTFVKQIDIEKILYNEELLNKFDNVFKIRKSLNLSHNNHENHEEYEYYKNIDRYIADTVTSFNKYLNTIIETDSASTPIEPFIYEDEGIKLSLLPGNKKDIVECIRSYVLEGKNKKTYSNLQYWEHILDGIRGKGYPYRSNQYMFVFKENRQKHFVILNINEYSISFQELMLTPRASKKLKALCGKQEFIDYIFKLHVMKEISF